MHESIIILELVLIALLIVFSLYKYQKIYKCRNQNSLKSHMLKIYGGITVTSFIYFVAQWRWVYLEVQHVIPNMDNILWYVFDFAWIITMANVLRIRLHDMPKIKKS